MKTKNTTKDKLLLILKKNKDVTIDKLVDEMTITEPAIRKHLNQLEKQQLVKKRTNKQEIGRPFYTYELAGEGHRQFPNQFEQLPVELLKDLEELQGPSAAIALLDKRMEREKSNLLAELDGMDIGEKVKKLTVMQNQNGYMLEVERIPEGDYILQNYNCPIMNIASKYNHVCSNEKTMYGRIFRDSNVESEAFITEGHNVCKWIIKAPKKDD